MGKYEKDLIQLIKLVGGEENISSVSHCVTRLRFVIKDESKINSSEIEKLNFVKGSFSTAGQFQVICGNNVKEVYGELIKITGIKGSTKEETKKIAQQKMSLPQKLVGGFAEIFAPLIPAIIVGGLILGFRNIIGDLAIFGNGSQTLTSIHPVLSEIHSFLWILGEAIFHFLPVGVAWSTVKKFGGTEILGIVLGITLVSPQLLNAYGYASAYANNTIPIWNFGLFTIQKVGYQAQVIPAMLSGIFLAKLEQQIKKIVPDILKLIIVPFVVLFVTVLVSYLLIGPISRELGNGIAFVFGWLMTGPLKILGAIIFGFAYAPLVITGLHHTILAVDLQLIATQGGTMLWTMVALSNIAQGSASIAMAYIYRKNPVINSLATGSGISAWLGVTEPAMFGVNLKYVYPFYAALIGSAVAAVYCTISGVLASSIGIGGLPAFLAIHPKYWISYIISSIIAIIIPMVLTYIFSKNIIKNKNNFYN